MPETQKNEHERDVGPQAVQILEASGVRLFRNSIGAAKLKGFWVRFGVGGKGGSDYVGYMPVRVTEAMVGQLVAVFVGCETKRPKGGVTTPEQKNFIANIKAAGGIAGFARNWQEARALVTDWFARFKA